MTMTLQEAREKVFAAAGGGHSVSVSAQAWHHSRRGCGSGNVCTTFVIHVHDVPGEARNIARFEGPCLESLVVGVTAWAGDRLVPQNVSEEAAVADDEPGPGLVQQIDGTLAQFRELFPELEEKADEKEGDDGT